jgi:hypothetical protein
MDDTFRQAVESLHPSFERLMSMQPCRDGQLPEKMPKAGVYLFSDGNAPLSVGRSNNLRARYARHCSPGATHRMASFAFRLSRIATDKLKASYKPGADSRAGLMQDTAFAAAFAAAKSKIRALEYRFVEEADPTRQALLEIYCSIALATPHNDFDNH